jgi:hypothetical protein
MNIITNKPVIFSNAEGGNPDAIKAAGDVLTGIGTIIILSYHHIIISSLSSSIATTLALLVKTSFDLSKYTNT